jgi:hypothetical protein
MTIHNPALTLYDTLQRFQSQGDIRVSREELPSGIPGVRVEPERCIRICAVNTVSLKAALLRFSAENV